MSRYWTSIFFTLNGCKSIAALVFNIISISCKSAYACNQLQDSVTNDNVSGLLQIGAVFLWSIVYNIVRVTSNVTEGDENAQTNETKVLNSGNATGTIAEENCSTSNGCTDECTLPLLSTRIVPAKDKVCQC